MIVIREKLLTYLFMLTAVPIAGELKFYPLDGGNIRISLGTPVFFFILLWSRKIHPVLAGISTGISVVIYRIILYGIQMDSIQLGEAFQLHFPAFCYYLSFALCFYVFKIHTMYEKPFLIGVFGIITEIISSMIEISLRSFSSNTDITASTFLVIGGIAIIRSFFVLGFFNILILRETRLAEEQQRNRNEQILLLISNLYIEMLQLKKTVKNAEDLTSSCYGLYRSLKVLGHQEEAHTALKLAGEIHEIKKDNQQIYAGLSKLMVKENLSDFMNIGEIITIITRANKTYGEMLGKSIDFHVNISGEHPAYHTFTLFSIINNLATNSVEAILTDGWIEISAQSNAASLELTISDNGCGVSEKNKPFIFEPRFTTKFDQTGVASNGIGLSYIKNVIEGIGGEINLLDTAIKGKTTFSLVLPITALTERG